MGQGSGSAQVIRANGSLYRLNIDTAHSSVDNAHHGMNSLLVCSMGFISRWLDPWERRSAVRSVGNLGNYSGTHITTAKSTAYTIAAHMAGPSFKLPAPASHLPGLRATIDNRLFMKRDARINPASQCEAWAPCKPIGASALKLKRGVLAGQKP